MESRWGLIPDMGISITLRELVRMDVAKELTMTGRIINGTEAERIGIVTRCVEDPMKEAMKVAMEIVERSPDSVAATKELFQSTWVADEETCLNIETDLQRKLIGER
jgi:enoyl-CoA hydratase/carnithine racemase